VSNHSHEEAGSGRTKSPYAARIRAIEALLLEKGVLTEPEVQDSIAYMEARSPANGAKLVARAWVDPDFKELLLADGKAAASKLHMDPEHPAEFIVVENTPEVHNLIVCTLCSCYPRAILGRPPDWYKSFEYRKRAVNEPRAVMRDFGFEPPEGVDVVVHDSTADARYMVLPMRPSGTECMDEEELAELVTRDALVGVNVPRSPSRTSLG
jgi:nitrile hydratase